MDALGRWIVCGRKKIYADRRTAHRAAVKARKLTGHKNITEYPCPVYQGYHFHIGHAHQPLVLPTDAGTELPEPEAPQRAPWQPSRWSRTKREETDV